MRCVFEQKTVVRASNDRGTMREVHRDFGKAKTRFDDADKEGGHTIRRALFDDRVGLALSGAMRMGNHDDAVEAWNIDPVLWCCCALTKSPNA